MSVKTDKKKLVKENDKIWSLLVRIRGDEKLWENYTIKEVKDV